MKQLAQFLHLLYMMLSLIVLFQSVMAQNYAYSWGHSLKGTNYTYPSCSVMDSAGSVYVSGYFNGADDFDPGPQEYLLSSAGGYDMFIVKFNKEGSFVWAKQFGGNGDDRVNDLKYDGHGNLYMAGVTAFYKLDTAGNIIWSRGISGFGSNTVTAITTDSSGNVYVTGTFGGVVIFSLTNGTTVGYRAFGPSDVYICKIDNSGGYLWAKRLSAIETISTGILVDKNNDVVVIGKFRNYLSFDAGSGAGWTGLISGGWYDAFILKLSTSGNFLWARQLKSTTISWPYDMVATSNGSIYIIGFFSNRVSFPESMIADMVSRGDEDMLIFKINSSGQFILAKQIGGLSKDYGQGLAQDNSGNLYITGNFSDTVNFGSGPDTATLISHGSTDVFIGKFDSSLNLKYLYSWGSKFMDIGSDIAVNEAGDIAILGGYKDTLDLDPGPGIDQAHADTGSIFIVKLNLLPNSYPATWLSLTGYINDQQHATISWTVLTSHAKEYTIEKSLNRQEFDSIGFVLSKGDGQQSYTFNESIPIQKVAWLRIKQINTDGRFTYSDIIEIANTKKHPILLYPVPVKEQLTIRIIDNEFLNSNATLIDAYGRQLKTIKLDAYNVFVNMHRLSHGMYFLKLKNGTSYKIMR